MSLYFSSDLHFGHENLRTKFNPERAERWKTLDEMNQGIIDLINSKVGADDEFWHLGDLSFMNALKTEELLSGIRCRKVNTLLGNHDSDYRIERIFDNLNSKAGFEKFFLAGDYAELNVGKQTVVLCHYPIRSWNKSRYGSWHLHGHCHGTLEPLGKSVDVGLDSKFVTGSSLDIFSWDQIRDFMDKRPIVQERYDNV